MFPSRISVPTPTTPEAEDIFSSALSNLFTDDTQNCHGMPGSSVTYDSPRFGTIRLRIPAHPDVEDGRKLFAHFLWNAGMIAADAIETASRDGNAEEQNGLAIDAGANQWNRNYWDVRGKRVLELGAGTALPSLISALSGAASTTITDHPSSPALSTGAIEQNVRDNVLDRERNQLVQDQLLGRERNQAVKHNGQLARQDQTVPDNALGQQTKSDASSNTLTGAPSSTTKSIPQQRPMINVFGYTWGTSKMYLPHHYGKPAPGDQQPSAFDRIIIADCLWMPSQHVNLVKTILQYMDPAPHTSSSSTTSPAGSSNNTNSNNNCALVVAGFHTGRGIVRHFFEVATGEWRDENEDNGGEAQDEDPELVEVQGRLKTAEIFEIDVNGVQRPWQPVRKGETKDLAKRWCVCAVLVRR